MADDEQAIEYRRRRRRRREYRQAQVEEPLCPPLKYTLNIQGGPKKVSHYRESSLNRIKNRQPG